MKKHFIIYFIFITVLAFIFLTFFSNSRVKDLTNEKYLDNAIQLQQKTKILIEQKQETTLVLALSLSQDTVVQNSLIKNDSTLLSLRGISKMYAIDSSLKHVWLHIVKPNGVSFIKSWSKQKGENISTIRKDIVKFFKNPKVYQVISVGKYDITIKAQVPIYKDEKMLGVFEVITKLNSIAKNLQKENINPIILADKSYKHQLKFPFTKTFINDYYVANLNADKHLLKLLDKYNIENIINKKDKYQIIDNYFLTIYHLNRLNNKKVGYIFLFQDLDKIDFSDIDTIYKNFILKWMSIIILIELLFFILLNRAYTKKLTSDVKLKTEENLQQMKVIEHQEKLASMGEMIGNIAHQWRQPLSVISTSATGMKLQKEFGILTDDMFYNSCDTINNNAQYLSKTIDDFRNFIKGDREIVKFKLSDSIKSFLHLIESGIKNHNIEIVENLDNTITMNGYPNELSQCFINIFNNSKDVFKEKEIDNRLFFISTSLENNNVKITLQDNAGGIPKDVLPKIFDPYFTTKHKSQGTGLGLHMTFKLIVDGMNGTIEAKNVEFIYNNKTYKGAQFNIVLPLEIKIIEKKI